MVALRPEEIAPMMLLIFRQIEKNTRHRRQEVPQNTEYTEPGSSQEMQIPCPDELNVHIPAVQSSMCWLAVWAEYSGSTRLLKFFTGIQLNYLPNIRYSADPKISIHPKVSIDSRYSTYARSTRPSNMLPV